MKALKFIVVVLLLLLAPNIYSRGGSFSSSSHSYSSSSHSYSAPSSRPSSFKSSSYTYKPSATSRTVTTSKTVSTTHTVSYATHTSRPVSSLTPSQRAYYHNNPSYSYVNGCYHPIYHYQPNCMLWYFVLRNNHTHRNDTIKAKSRQELDQKVKSSKAQW
jgi:hypothetical protein